LANPTPTIRIGVYGEDYPTGRERHGCGLWPAGIAASLTAAEAVPVPLGEQRGRAREDLLDGLHGMVIAGHDNSTRRQAAEGEQLCAWCHDHKLPVLGIDHGLHVLNTTHGGTVYFDLPRDLPEALQHRHPPEPGLRHAINVLAGTHLADLYGEGEVVVNSEHRRAVHRLARSAVQAGQRGFELPLDRPDPRPLSLKSGELRAVVFNRRPVARSAPRRDVLSNALLQTSSIWTISAASPARWPILTIRV